jgi:hypothetical protein
MIFHLLPFDHLLVRTRFIMFHQDLEEGLVLFWRSSLRGFLPLNLMYSSSLGNILQRLEPGAVPVRAKCCCHVSVRQGRRETTRSPRVGASLETDAHGNLTNCPNPCSTSNQQTPIARSSPSQSSPGLIGNPY